MVNRRLPLTEWFRPDYWPLLPCPSCNSGMSIDGQHVTEVETFESFANRNHDDFEPTWIKGHFHGLALCGNSQCKLRVIVVGEFKTESVGYHEGHEWHGEYWGSFYKLTFTQPPIPIMDRVEGVSNEVWELIVDASRIAWVDPAASVGRLRAALEVLMDDFKIRKLMPNRKPLTLHARLESFSIKKPDAAALFLAVKWAGNEGVHRNQGLTTEDVLESAELMEHGLKILYDKSPIVLQKRAATINKAKRLPRTRSPKQES